jgi:nucleotide-binding universal stress UspA family protein
MLLQIQQIKGKITGGTTEKEIQVKGNVGIGYPAEEILKFADTNQADLIMLSTHGASGIRRWALGNVVDKVIHSTKVPIWLVPSELRDEVINDQVTKRTMVIPLNGSEKAETVLPYALALAKQRGAETRFVLIGVTRSGAVPVLTGESKNYYFNQFIEGTRPDKEVYFQSIIKRIQDAGFEADAEILKGDPPEEIVKYVSTHPTQLIAMATNGASPITEFLFSTVTENVVRRIKKTPIFLVRPR